MPTRPTARTTWGTPISIANGQYRIDGGNYTSTPGTIGPNQTVQVMVTSAAGSHQAVHATLKIGAAVQNFTVTTAK